MSYTRYTEEFKRDAVSQVTDRGYSIKEVSERLGICKHVSHNHGGDQGLILSR